MTNSNNDIEELEELLTELEGQEAQIVTPYSEEDDAVTRLMDAPLGDQDWMVQVTALDRRMMSTSQLLSELQAGKVNQRTLVWRGGMDDWMPVSRIDELSRASAPAPLVHSAPRNSSPRVSYSNLAPPPPAPQRSQPLWSNPPSAPLPPPPSAMSPPIAMAPGMGMPPPPMALAPPPPPPPMALTPPPAPASYGLPMQLQSSASLPEPPMSQGNTTRPVAVDFSDMSAENDPPLQSKRWVMALSAVAILAVFVTVYSLSTGGGESESKAATAVATRPQAVNALQPSATASKEKEKPAASAPSAASGGASKVAAPVATAAAKPSAEDENDSEASESGSARQTAQARYTPRSEYRRRSRSGSGSDEKDRAEAADEEEPAPSKPAAALAATAPAPSSTARAAEDEEAPSEPVASVAEEVDEPAKGRSSNNTFNREAAKTALDEAAAQAKNCRPQGGPSGTGRVQVRYEPSGKVANVAILTSKFDNTTAGSCVRMLFRRAKVPEFTGAPVMVVNKSFEIP